jgi:hypothetical protein
VIFESFLYNIFIKENPKDIDVIEFDNESADLKARFLRTRNFDADLILSKFSIAYNKIFPDEYKPKVEKVAGFIFLMFINNIINGTGNYYIEPQTRDSRRLDVVIDYLGKQTIIEFKIWHGDQYNSEGKAQLASYLGSFNLDLGYMLVFSNLMIKDVKGKIEEYVDGKKIITYIV